METKIKKAVVTGGAGFIGSHLTEALLRNGFGVVVIDNLSTGRMENIHHFINEKNLEFINADINEVKKSADCFKEIDYVFHLAALADIVPSIVNPLAYYHSNVSGTINVLETMRKFSGEIKKFVYIASSSCYGIPEKYPTPENAQIRLQYPYALSKYLGEEISLHWASVYKLPVVSLRLFNVYGPRSRTSGTYGAVFGVFLAQKLNHRPFTVVGDGSQTRDFTYVTDVVEALIKAAFSEVKNEIFNVGSGNPQSINRLIELLGGERINIPKRPGEPDCTWADISKIKRMLNWEPKVSFHEGVKMMLADIDCWRDAPLWTPETIEIATREWFQYLSKPACRQAGSSNG